MSPIRKVDDYRHVEIDSWDDYIQEEIVGMYARGEMDDLPDKGKPIKIWKTEVNPEYDLAFSRLKNAGVMPLWMELDAEIGRMTSELWSRLDVVETELRVLLTRLKAPVEAEPEAGNSVSLWERFVAWFRVDFSSNDPPPPTITLIMATRERERRRFLDLADRLDKKIVSYHDALPKGAEHLQRFRWLPDRAARVFDERIALTDWWEESRDESA